MKNSKIGTLYKRLKEDLDVFRKSKDVSLMSASRFIIGELQRNPNKDYSNKTVKKTIAGIRKNMTKSPEPDNLVMSLIDTYIGSPVTSGEAIEWLEDNGYDADTIKGQKNPFAIIGIMKKSFIDREVDGNMVSKVLADIIEGKEKEIPVAVEDVQESGLMQSLVDEMFPDEMFDDEENNETPN